MKKVWPEKAGCLCARMSRGFNGQDAVGLTVVTGVRDDEILLRGERAVVQHYDAGNSEHPGLYARSAVCGRADGGKHFGGGTADTLTASYCKGTGTRNGKEREVVAIEKEPVVYPGVGITNPVNQSSPVPGDPAPTLTEDSRNYMVQERKKRRKYIVRRLTPTECARLQGFSDWWTDGADGSDSAKYKLWGNGIALPCAEDVIGRCAEELRKSGQEEERHGQLESGETPETQPVRAGRTDDEGGI